MFITLQTLMLLKSTEFTRAKPASAMANSLWYSFLVSV